MHTSPQSSRQRFEEYREQLSEPPTVQKSAHAEKPEKSALRTRTTGGLLRAFWSLLAGQRAPLGWALATLTISTILGLAPPAATKLVVDYVLGDQIMPVGGAWNLLPRDRWTLLASLTGGVLVISIFKTGLHLWGRWHATRVAKRLQLSIRKRLFEHAVRLPLPRVQEMKSGGMASLLREDTSAIGDLVFGLLYNPWRAAVQLLGSLCVLAIVDWRLLLGAVAVLPAVYLTHRTWIRRIRPRFKDIRIRRQQIDGQTTEVFGGIRIVRAFGRQRTETTRIMSHNHLMARQELFVWWWMRAIEVIWALLIPASTGALMLYGGWQVLQGSLTVGDLMMFIVYLAMLLEPLAILAESAASLQNGLSALDRVLDLLDEDKEMQTSTALQPVVKDQIVGRLDFENVWFRYSSDAQWALKEIDLAVAPGQTVALVGASGAGKTTLTNLAARFYDPTEGRVLLDGQDLREFDVEGYRKILGVVEQDVFLFDGTVADNIGYAVQDAAPEAIERAAEMANAHQFISELPTGYQTWIGERGVKLSGGQRQRIAIARAILADPRILILDEATSNLDTESERLIQRSLKALMQGRTSFVIAHRLSTIHDADLIVVLDGGTIVEAGTPEELLATDGHYRRMTDLQRSLHVDVIDTIR